MYRWRRMRAAAAAAACLALVTCCLVVVVRLATLQVPDVHQLRLLRAVPGVNESTLDLAVEIRGSLHGFGLTHLRASLVTALPADCHSRAAAAVEWYTCASAPSVPHATAARGAAVEFDVVEGGVVVSLVLAVDARAVAGAISGIISAGVSNNWVGGEQACLHAAVRGSVHVTPWLSVRGDYALAVCARLPHVVPPEYNAREEPPSDAPGPSSSSSSSSSGGDGDDDALEWSLGPVRCRMTSADFRRAFGTDRLEFEIIAEHDVVHLLGEPVGVGAQALSLRGRLGANVGDAGGGDIGIEANMTHIVVQAAFDESAAHRVRRALLSVFAIDAGPLSGGPALVATWRGPHTLLHGGLLQTVLDALKIDVPLTWQPPRLCDSAFGRRVEASDSGSADWSLLGTALNVAFERCGLDSIEALVVSPTVSAGSDRSSGLVIAATLMLRKRLLPVRALDVRLSAPFDTCLPTVSVGGVGIRWCAASSMMIAGTSLGGGGIVRVSTNMSILPSSGAAAAAGAGAAAAATATALLGSTLSNLLGGGGPAADRRVVVAVPPSSGEPLAYRLLRGLFVSMPAQLDVVAAWEAMPDERCWVEVAPPGAGGAAGRLVMTFERSRLVPNIAFGAPRVDLGSAYLLVNSDAPRDVCDGPDAAAAAYNASAEADGGRIGVSAGVTDYGLLRFRAFMRVTVVLFDTRGRRGAATSQFVTGLLSRPTRVVLSGAHRGLSLRVPWVVAPVCGPLASVGRVTPQLGGGGATGAYDVEVIFVNALPVSLSILGASLFVVDGGDGWALSGVPRVELPPAPLTGDRCAARTTMTVHASLQQLPSEAPLAAAAAVRAVLVGAVVVNLGGVVTTTVQVGGSRGVPPVCPWDELNATAFSRRCAAFGAPWYVRVDAAVPPGGGTLPVVPPGAADEDRESDGGGWPARSKEEEQGQGSCVIDASQGVMWASCAPELAVGAALGTPLVCLCAACVLTRMKECWRRRGKSRGYITVAQDEEAPAAAIDTAAPENASPAAAAAAEPDVTHAQLPIVDAAAAT